MYLEWMDVNTMNGDVAINVCKYLIWQYGILSFQASDTKLERFFPKNQHTQRKFMNFENCCDGELPKIQKRIGSAKTIRGNMVCGFSVIPPTWKLWKLDNPYYHTAQCPIWPRILSGKFFSIKFFESRMGQSLMIILISSQKPPTPNISVASVCQTWWNTRPQILVHFVCGSFLMAKRVVKMPNFEVGNVIYLSYSG